MITMNDALRLIEERREDAVVLPTMTATRGWQEMTHNEDLDLPVAACLGKASSVALGVCIARPDKKIIVVDGDGSLLMNLGSLVTIGGMSPENLYHSISSWTMASTPSPADSPYPIPVASASPGSRRRLVTPDRSSSTIWRSSPPPWMR